MKPDRALLVGLACGLVVAILVGGMMLDNNNQGEFADTSTGELSSHFWQAIGIFFAATTVFVGGLLTLIGLARRTDD